MVLSWWRRSNCVVFFLCVSDKRRCLSPLFFFCFEGVGGDFVLLEKSKKERIRKLSTIGRGATSSSLEMGCDVSDREDEELPSKRIKLPRKVAERALFMRNNDHIENLIKQNRKVLLPIMLEKAMSKDSV